MSFTNWLRNLRSFGHLGTTARKSRPAARCGPAKRFRLHLECFEDRCLPSTFTVLNTNDSGAGSLRQPILDANAHANTHRRGPRRLRRLAAPPLVSGLPGGYLARS